MRRLHLPLCLIVGAAFAALGSSCCSVNASGPTPISVEAALPRAWDAEVFKTAVRALEAECPLNAPAMVSVGRIDGDFWGLTSWVPSLGLYRIQIESRQPLQAIIDTLQHEWAHAMVWDASEGPEYDSHGPLWGVAQARCYRAVLAALLELDARRAAEAGDEAPAPPAPVEGGWEAPGGKVLRCSHEPR